MKNKLYILGISAFYHDSAASIICEGEIIAAAQEERFTRIKHTEVFPENAIKYCLEEAGISIDELNAVVFYDKPLLKFERLLQTYYSFAPKGLISFLKAIPIWLNEKLFLKKLIRNGLSNVQGYEKSKLRLLFTTHHLSHGASAFYPSPFDEAAILTVDGVGEWATASIALGKGASITTLKEMEFPHSVGLLYSSFTYFLGFKVNSGEYKLMGLAPYGNPESKLTTQYIDLIKTNLVDIKSDGSIWLDQKYFNYATGLHMIHDKKWESLFNLKKRLPDDEIDQSHCDLALAIQLVTEEIVVKLVKTAKEITGAQNLCLAGGVALNCVANRKILESEVFENVYIQPASGDAGGSLGAALAAYYMYFEKERLTTGSSDEMHGSYLGPSFSEKEIMSMNKKTKAIYAKSINYDSLAAIIANEIAEGKIVGWFQGRMEFGPRALGNRSILADPRNEDMQRKLNLKIKYREGFRPFAPSVLLEKSSAFFNLIGESPYMLHVSPLAKDKRNILPKGYDDLAIWDKLYIPRSEVPAVTHLDFSARVQTVSQKTNERYWKLISAFDEITNCPLLINTSFNVRGEPIVASPYDAYRCFMSTDMDILVINDFIYQKSEQKNSSDKSAWKTTFDED